MVSRRGRHYNSYRQALLRGGSAPNIPESTLRGWIRKGTFTPDELQQLGIQTNRRRRIPRNIPDQHARPIEDQGSESEREQEDIPAAADNLIVSDSENDADESDRDSVHQSADGSEGNVDDDGESVRSDESFNSLPTDSGESDIDDSDDRLLSEQKRLLAILNSKTIGRETLNGRVHPNLRVTKFEVLLMILHLSVRHRMTNIFLEHLLQFVDNIIGIPDCLGMSNFLFQKLFQFGKKPRQHYYCPDCLTYLGHEDTCPDGKVICQNEECAWSSTTSSLNNGNYFLTLDIKSQLQDVLNRPDIAFVSKERVDDVTTDMMDGLEYKHNIKAGILSSDPEALTLTLSTDGSPVFKNGNNSLWPVHFLINEIAPQDRFRSENLMLAGIWFGKSEPNMHLYLQPIIAELKHLESDGVKWTKPDGSVVESHVYVFACCTDAPARAKVQNHQLNNGVYGCGMCLHPNTEMRVTTQEKKKGRKKNGNENNAGNENYETKETTVYRYLYQELEYRTNKGMRDHMKLAARSQFKHIFGSHGLSEFCALKRFNVVYGFPIDYLHATLLGTVRRTVNLWFDSTSHGQPYYIGLQVHLVDERIKSIKLPTGFRPPRPISDRVHWKGNEWRAFLLYFALVVLHNILPAPYFNNFKLLVCAIYIMSKDVILRDELIHAQVLMERFVKDYQRLYGEMNMVFCLHSNLHLPRVVARMGPLWAYSTFSYESANGRLVKLAKGTKGVATQICRKHLMTNNATRLLSYGYESRPKILEFCSEVVDYSYGKISSKGENNETLLGREKLIPLNACQKQAFSDEGIVDCDSVYTVLRAVIKKQIYHSRKITKQKVASDSCIRLTSGEFALIDYIAVINRNLNDDLVDSRLIVTMLNVSTEVSPLMVSHIKQCNILSFGETRLICSTEIANKCIFYNSNGKNWVAEISNFYETD